MVSSGKRGDVSIVARNGVPRCHAIFEEVEKPWVFASRHGKYAP
jgi:hypothetical protein